MDENFIRSTLAWTPPSLEPLGWLDAARDVPALDVRSPSEFQHGHFPGAVNLPLFDDAERAEVGIAYKQQGQAAAYAIGLDIARPKIDWFVRESRRIAQDAKVLVHCWRGGLRSRSFAHLLAQRGLDPWILEGGYKAYRRTLHESLGKDRPMVVLSGLTGAGKTHVLHMLSSNGEQVIDLESLANHRGSAFGGLGQQPQPTVEQFENEIFEQWRGLDPSRPVWLEDESQAIGKIRIPQPLWHQMRAAPAIFLNVPRSRRVSLLVQDYGALPTAELALATDGILKRLGGLRWRAARNALQEGDQVAFAEIVLSYYDKAYLHATKKRPRKYVYQFDAPQPTDPNISAELRQVAAFILKTGHEPAQRSVSSM